MQAIAAARSGSTSDVQAICHNLSLIPVRLRGDTVEMIFSHLRADPGPLPISSQSIVEPETSKRIKRAYSAICSLSLVHDWQNWASEDNPATRAGREWDDVFKWMKYLYRLASRGLTNLEAAIYKELAGVVVFVCSLVTSAKILADTRLLRLMSKLWLRADLSDKADLRLPLASKALQMCLYELGDRHAGQNILSGIAGSEYCVADHALALVKACLDVDLQDLEGIQVHLTNMHYLICCSCAPIRPAVLAAGGVATVTNALLRLSGVRCKKSFAKTSFDVCIRMCFNFLFDILRNPGTPQLARQTLRHGLVEALAKLTPVVDSISNIGDEHEGALQKLLTVALPPYTVFATVLSQIDDAITKLATDDMKSILKSSLKEPWTSWQQSFLDRASFRSRLDEASGARDRLYQCSTVRHKNQYAVLGSR